MKHRELFYREIIREEEREDGPVVFICCNICIALSLALEDAAEAEAEAEKRTAAPARDFITK
jgi:hypothetical protein